MVSGAETRIYDEVSDMKELTSVIERYVYIYIVHCLIYP